MKRAKVAFGGAIHEAYEHPAGLKLADGRVVAEDAVVWLPPFEVGTIIALGLELCRPCERTLQRVDGHCQRRALGVSQRPQLSGGPSLPNPSS